MKKWFELIRGDITLLDVDAIVNAANNSLLGAVVLFVTYDEESFEIYRKILNV